MSSGSHPTGRDLRPLFDPRSVAIVGASDDSTKWGHGLAARALAGEDRRSVHLVNRSRDVVLGRRAVRSLHDLAEAPDLVVIAVDANAFEVVVGDALDVGARAIVVLTAGLGELGTEGARREQEVLQKVREAGAVLVGPNCMGVFDATAELDLVGLTHGSIGVVAQSGNFALELEQLAADHDLGFSRFASLGNQVDLDVAEVVRALATHDPTAVVAVYCEDFGDGRRFVEAAAAAEQAGKPVLLLDAGRSAAGAVAARSHTGALLSPSRTVEAACRAAGVLRVRTPRELVDLAAALLAGVRPRGRRIGVLTDGGFNGVIACDLATDHRLEVPRLSDQLSGALTEVLSPLAPTRNPVDLADAGPRDFLTYSRSAELLAASQEIDAVLLTGYFGGYGREGGEAREREVRAADAIGEVASRSSVSVVAQSMFPGSETATVLRRAGVPVYRDTATAIAVLARLARREERPPTGIPPLPAPGEPVSSSGYWEARTLFASAGIPFPDAARVRTHGEAASAAASIGYPVVLKALTHHLHKSAVGGVVVGIDGPGPLAAAFERLQAALDPPSFSVERTITAPGAMELVIGCERDPRFGLIALVGLGGLRVELLDDVATALAPVEEEVALALLADLRAAPMLAGLDQSSAARAVATLTHLAAQHPEIAELEINPLLVTPDGAIALDARLVRST